MGGGSFAHRKGWPGRTVAHYFWPRYVSTSPTKQERVVRVSMSPSSRAGQIMSPLTPFDVVIIREGITGDSSATSRPDGGEAKPGCQRKEGLAKWLGHVLKQNLGEGLDRPEVYKPMDQISEWIRVGTMVLLGTLASCMICEEHFVFSFRRPR